MRIICHPYVIRMSFVYYPYAIRMSSVCHSYIIRMPSVSVRSYFYKTSVKYRMTYGRMHGSVQGVGPGAVVKTACLGSRRSWVRAPLWHSSFKETICSLVEIQYWSLRDREVACSPSDRQGSNFESCVWRVVSSHSYHHPQEVDLAQFSLYVHKGGLEPHLSHAIHMVVFG